MVTNTEKIVYEQIVYEHNVKDEVTGKAIKYFTLLIVCEAPLYYRTQKIFILNTN